MAQSKDQLEREKRRAEDLKTLTSDDFYKCSLNGDINIIISQRSDGKTYDRIAHCLKKYKEHQHRFVYVRRWAEDITIKNMSRLMDPFMVNKYVKTPLLEELFGPNKAIRCVRGMFELYDTEDSDFIPEKLGYYVALNQVAHTKSVPFTNVKNIILDEFLQLKSERVLSNEFDAWEQTISTIVRADDDVQIWLLGNTVSKYSDYFAPYGIDIANLKQGEIKKIELPNDDGKPTRVEVEWCKYNPKIGQKTSKYVRGSKMAITGEWELDDVANIPHTDNERANEKMLFSMYDYVMGLNIGVYLRTAIWFTYNTEDYVQVKIPHKRQFLVVRQTNKKSSYYHLTNVKDLKYNTWTNIDDMLADIKERCNIDVKSELKHNRVFCSDSFTADYFYHTYLNYQRMGVKDLL